MTDPLDKLSRMLAGLELGREIANENRRARSAALEAMVRQELDRDILAGHPDRGRAVRISRRLRGDVTERGVRKILERLDQSFRFDAA